MPRPKSLSLIDPHWVAALSPDGKFILISQREQVLLWDGEMFISWRDLVEDGNPAVCFGIAWAPDGRSFARCICNAIILYDPTKQSRMGRVSISRGIYERLCYVNTTTLALLSQGSLQMLVVAQTSNKATGVVGKTLRFSDYLNSGPNGQFELVRDSACREIIILRLDPSRHQHL